MVFAFVVSRSFAVRDQYSVAALPPDVRKVNDLSHVLPIIVGLRPWIQGVAQNSFCPSEGLRPSAHQAAKPRQIVLFRVQVNVFQHHIPIERERIN